MNFPSFQALVAAGTNRILVQQGLLSVASVQRSGTDANIIVNTGAAMGDQISFVLQRMWSALFFATAQGTDLDRLALDRYNLIRKPAASALGSVQLSTTSPVLAPAIIPLGTLFTSVTGLTYQSTSTVVWPVSTTSAAPYTSPLIPIASTLAGANQQASVGSITALGSVVSGMPGNLTVNNPLATAGAADTETDNQFRARCIAFPQTLLQGTLGAIIQAALGVAGVQSANAIEVLNYAGQQNGFVQLVITDGFTQVLSNLNQNPPTYQAQSQQLAGQVAINLDTARAGGIFVQPYVAEVVLIQSLLSLGFAAGIDVDTAALNARIAVVNYTNALPPGVTWQPGNGTIDGGGASGAALTVPGVIACNVVSPAGPVVPTSLQVLRTSLGLVTAALSAGSIISQGSSINALTG